MEGLGRYLSPEDPCESLQCRAASHRTTDLAVQRANPLEGGIDFCRQLRVEGLGF